MSISKEKYKADLNRKVETFKNHIQRFQEVGSLGIGITLDLDLVMWSPLPKRKHGKNKFFFRIETPVGTASKEIYESKVFEIDRFNEKTIEKNLRESLDIVFKESAEIVCN